MITTQRGKAPHLMRALVTGVMLTWALPAWAHSGGGAHGGFFSGFAHPISGLDHIVAMVSVGLWGAQLGRPAIWVLPVAFPTVMAFGGLLGLLGVPIPGVEIGIAVSALVLGAMVALAQRPPLWVACAIVSVFAICHGHAHGTELPPGEDGLTYSLGFVTGTGLLHGAGILLGLVWERRWGRPVIRGLGAAVAASGPYFLWTIFAQ